MLVRIFLPRGESVAPEASSAAPVDHRKPQPGFQAVEAEPSTAVVVAAEEHRRPQPRLGFLRMQDWTS